MRKKKKYLIVALFMFIGVVSYSQVNFKWDVIIDSLADNKDDLYSKTKLFISENWNSAQDVIQNDDKDAGVILIKGTLQKERNYATMTSWKQFWTFSYTIKFFMKDTKCRIVIESVNCQSARDDDYNKRPIMPIADFYPSSKGKTITGLTKEKYFELMRSLKSDLQSIVDSYSIYVKNPIVENNEW